MQFMMLTRSSPGRKLLGRRYQMPARVQTALERVFATTVADIKVIEHSRYARAHIGMTATTRPSRILLSISGEKFVSHPALLLHEFYHVLRQWRTGRMTRCNYLMESMRRGYQENRFEREAREFAEANVELYISFLNRPP